MASPVLRNIGSPASNLSSSNEGVGIAPKLLARRYSELTASTTLNLPQPKYYLNDLSNPPTDEELSNYVDMPPSALPPKYKRDIKQRVFVNRDLRLDRIQFFGFDMDYTLAIYNSPEFEQLIYHLVVDQMVLMGYPDSIKSLKYDPNFPIRGLLLDRDLGNLIKTDNFGNITFCVHGRTRYSKEKMQELYPSMMVHGEDITRRFYMLTTLFTIPEACLYADLVEHLEKAAGIRLGEEVAQEQELDDVSPHEPVASTPQPPQQAPAQSDLSYSNLWQDLRVAMDRVHDQGHLKEKVLNNLEKYIKRTQDLSIFLDNLRLNNRKTFLLTNSEFFYTERVMTYLLDGMNPAYKNWKEYFDVVIVGAQKPLFFGTGTTLREVNIPSGNLKLTQIGEKFEVGKVYHGGSMSLFQKMTGAKGSKVLYVGDHIFADIIKSKKVHGWRNLLIIPELHHELKVWGENQDKYNHLINLEFIKAEMFRELDFSNSKQPPDIMVLRKHIKKTDTEVNKAYNEYFGSLFRSGSKPSFFAMQVQRYADLYTSEYSNLLNYPLFYEFSANSSWLPHETTSTHKEADLPVIAE